MPKKTSCEPVPVAVSAYDWYITVKKFFTGLGITIIPVIILYSINFLETEEFPPEYAVYIPLFVAVLHAILNLVKHYNDKKIILIDPETGKVVEN